MRHSISKAVVLTLLLAVLSPLNALASKVKNLEIDVVIYRDGNAYVEERWDIDIDDSDAKSEWYVKHKAQPGMVIDYLLVEGYIPGKKGLQQFETLGSWDLDASREEKTGKCGIHNGDEICWGFGDYGRHQYVVRYSLSNLVQSYDTNDGFNHCFVDMNCEIEKASVTIWPDSIDISEANTRRWAFGYQGNIDFVDGCVVATPNETIGNGKRIIVMLEFDKGLFEPAMKASKTWAERKQEALDGSDFPSDDDDWDFWDYVIAFVFIILCLIGRFLLDMLVNLLLYILGGILMMLWWIISLAPLRLYYRRKRIGIAEGRYYREVNPEWSLVENRSLINELSYFSTMSDENLLGAIILRLISRGDISIVKEKWKGKLTDMMKIERPVKHVSKELTGDDKICEQVLRMLTQASGNDLILQPKEFEKWGKSHYTTIKEIVDAQKEDATDEYINKNGADVFGLKAFLKDFSLLNERGIMEVKLWDDYMVYAQFFGIADKVMAEMKKLNPEYMSMSNLAKNLELADEGFTDVWTDVIHTGVSEAIDAHDKKSSSSSSGFSSWSSSGGGGGCSGGGGGGGR
ncbi:MAG: DUF2207 domain-containing protein [Bacteroidaceae bacterium]|nr:DUF2207 domain-containing protein [Bacteroidaceae bacterium]